MSAIYDDKGSFEGFAGSDCDRSEHRTVGEHRAWCHRCSEWCYPNAPCDGCAGPALRAHLVAAYKAVEDTDLDGCAYHLRAVAWLTDTALPTDELVDPVEVFRV